MKNISKSSTSILLIFFIVSLLWYVLRRFDAMIDLIYFMGTAAVLYYLLRQLQAAREGRRVAREREEQLRFLINTMPDFVCYKDAEGRWVEANTFSLELFQLTEVDYRGKRDRELAQYTDFYSEALLYCDETDQAALMLNEPTRLEEVIPQPDGSVLVFDVIKVPTFHENGERKGLVVIGRNITERKDAERRLEESQQRYKSLFEENPDPIFSLDLNGKFRSANEMCEKLTGYTKQELLCLDYSKIVDEKDVELGVEKFNQTLNRESPTYELTIRHKDGHSVQIKVTNVPIVVNNEIIGIYGMATDLTEWKMAEEMLRKSDRLSVIGQLAAGVAHEIRNPLASLSGFVQLLKEQSTEHRFYYDIMSSELNRINLIVSEFMFLAKPQVFTFETKEVEHILAHVVPIAQTQATINNVQIWLEHSSADSHYVNCEENQLKQVFINILKNAIEAMPNGGELLIRMVEDVKDHIVIRFIDRGMGIPTERIARLGEPFYSTKEKGMGLGLMVCYKIIEAHKGKIEVMSELGRGTTVDVVLPLVPGS